MPHLLPAAAAPAVGFFHTAAPVEADDETSSTSTTTMTTTSAGKCVGDAVEAYEEVRGDGFLFGV